MAHKTLIGGTAYEISGGKTLIGGTAYEIAGGRTLVGGTGYDISFQSGTPIADLAVGSFVYMNVNGTAKKFLIVHQGKPSSLYDDSCNGTWLLMNDIYERRPWNSSGSNSYKASTIHTYLNGTFLDLFDADIKEQIKTVKIPYVNGTGASAVASGSSGLSTQIFLLSGYEVGWTQYTSSQFPIDGACLSYFSGTAPTDSKRIAYFDGTAIAWLCRSPNNRDTSSVWGSNETGWRYLYGVTASSMGVRPALILPSETCVDDSGNVLA